MPVFSLTGQFLLPNSNKDLALLDSWDYLGGSRFSDPNTLAEGLVPSTHMYPKPPVIQGPGDKPSSDLRGPRPAFVQEKLVP